jgi:hypothetical protein
MSPALDGSFCCLRHAQRRCVAMPTTPSAAVAPLRSSSSLRSISCGVRRRGPLIRRLAALQITMMHRPCTPEPWLHRVKSGEPPPKRTTPALPRPAGAPNSPPRLPRAQSPRDGANLATNPTRHTGPSPLPRVLMGTAGEIRSAPILVQGPGSRLPRYMTPSTARPCLPRQIFDSS